MATEAVLVPAPVRRERDPRSALNKAVWRVVRVACLIAALWLLMLMRSESQFGTNLLYFALALAATYVALGAAFKVWGFYVAAFALFALLRGYADGLGATVQYDYPIDVERAIFFGTIPTIWLQERLYTFAHLGPLETYTMAVYLSYFFVPHVMALALWKYDRERFDCYALAFFATLYLGLLTSAILPTAPPWLAGQLGYIPHVYQVVPDIAGEVSPGTYQSAYEVAGANPVAAMPSLHAAVPFLMAIALWKYRWVRWVGALYATSMLLAITYLGEHYVVDGLAGWGVAGACWLVAAGYLARRNANSRVNERAGKDPMRGPFRRPRPLNALLRLLKSDCEVKMPDPDPVACNTFTQRVILAFEHTESDGNAGPQSSQINRSTSQGKGGEHVLHD